jgi:hypothetical protein
MLRLATFPPATCRIVQLLGCIPAMLVTIFCAWMAALGWSPAADAAAWKRVYAAIQDRDCSRSLA